MPGSNSRETPRDPAIVAFTRWYDGRELAQTGARFAARLPLSAFGEIEESLGDMLARRDAQLDAAVEFSREGPLMAVQGSCRVTLHLVCQRCLQPYALPLDCEFSLLATESEGMLARASADEERETVLVEDRVRPLDFVAEELLLALPLVPRHPDPAECVDLSAWTQDDAP